MKKLLLAALVAVISLPAFGAELERLNESVRALGMGGAFTAVADDEGALFYNPAGLARQRKLISFGVLNPLVEINSNTIDFIDDFDNTNGSSPAEIANLIRDYIGDPVYTRATVMPYFTGFNFGIAALGRVDLAAEAHNLINPELETHAERTVSLHGGYAMDFDGLAVGGVVKIVDADTLNRTYEAVEIAAKDFFDLVRDDFESDTGFGLDVGALYTFDIPLSPTVGVAVINLVNPGIKNTDVFERQVNLGASAKLDLELVELLGAIDVFDVTTNIGEDDDFGKRLHVGVELVLPLILSLRAGINQGYPTVGVTTDFLAAKLEYAYYMEEIGSSAGSDKDRRQVLQFTLGW